MNAIKLYLPSALFIIAVMLYGWLSKGDTGALWIMCGFLITLGGAFFVVTKFSKQQQKGIICAL
jgi:positive regulator of sigma E activity